MYKKTKLITLSKMQQITSHFPAGDRSDLSFLHLHLHPLLLPEDPPGHAGARHQERHRQLEEFHHLEPGQGQHQPTRRFLLYRVYL